MKLASEYVSNPGTNPMSTHTMITINFLTSLVGMAPTISPWWVVIAFIIYWILPHRVMGTVPASVQRLAGQLVESMEPEDGEEEKELDGSTKVGRQRCAKMAAAYVRSKVGLMKRTEANRQVAGRLIRDHLQERGVRPTHIMAIAPIAEVLCFVPTEADITAAQLLASTAVLNSIEEAEAKWYSEETTWLFRKTRRFGPKWA